MSFDEVPDAKLADQAQEGLRGQGAVVEMMRRLKQSVIALDRSTTRLNRLMLAFTIAIFLLTTVQVIVQLSPVVIKSTFATVSTALQPIRTSAANTGSNQMKWTAIGFLLGIVGSLAAAIGYDRATKPKLIVSVDENRALGQLPGQPPHEFYHLIIRQKPAPRPFPGRRPAWDCKITLEVLNNSGESTLPEPIVGRWTSQPEPQLPVVNRDQVGNVLDPARVVQASRNNVHAHEEQRVSVAVKYDGSENCHLFSNSSYLFPRWQNPDWRLGPGSHRLKVTLYYERGPEVWHVTLTNTGTGRGDIVLLNAKQVT